ncbi:SpaH/EbpB family LPXTG-anchored major pilin [Atopobium fossor]|uniref:SpaH/EbpB family LPXTG-anchored major pilin n=1 Tax=Atopobium fossor TaxID=39487 RepID=UPI000426EFA6|nr:SpaH/EbpB family LPXTG-anchored major pilin [Atopobium fossor]
MLRLMQGKVKGMLAVTAAILLAFIMVVTPALADDFDVNAGKLTVAGLKDGDQVKIYQVVVTEYDAAKNTLSNKFADAGNYGGIDFTAYSKMGNDATGLNETANKIATAVAGGATTASTQEKTATGASVEFTNLKAGQYLVVVTNANDSTRVFQNTIASVEPTVQNGAYAWPADNTITVKSGTLDPNDPSNTGVNKRVNGADNIDTITKGDTVNYTIDATLPKYAVGATDRVYTIADTVASGLTLNDDIVVKINNTVVNAGAEYTINKDIAGGTFTITVSNATLLASGGQPIHIEYTGKAADTVTYATAGTNEAELTFSSDSTTNTTKKQKDTTHTTFYKITFKKVNAAAITEGISGVEFDVFKADNTKVGHLVTGTDGAAEFDGLAAGAYYLVETKVPAGYDLDQTPHNFTVTSDVQANTFAGTVQAIDNITNNKSNSLGLPITGGPGTIALTAGGLVIMVGAIVYLVRARRND